MLDLAQHRCSAAAKNQVGVSVSEHVCVFVYKSESADWCLAVRKDAHTGVLDVMVRI